MENGNKILDKYLMRFVKDTETKFTITNSTGDYTEITKAGISDFVTSVYGDKKFNLTMDDNGIINYLKILKQHKIYKFYNIDHELPNIFEKKKGQITRLKLGAAKVELAIPEDIQVVCVGNSAYIYVEDNLYMEVHGSKSIDRFIVIDYYSNIFNIVKNSNTDADVSMYGSFAEEDPYVFYQFQDKNYKIDFNYINGIHEDITKSEEKETNRFFSYRVDIYQDEDILEKIMGIVPIPFIITDDDFIEFSDDHRTYMSYIYEFDEKGYLETEVEYFISYSSEECNFVNSFWNQLIEDNTDQE